MPWEYYINESSTAAIHFVTGEMTSEQINSLSLFSTQHGLVINLDYEEHLLGNGILSQLSRESKLPFSPLNNDEWVRFVDVMVALSKEQSGVLIVLDKSMAAFQAMDREILKFIEYFFNQLESWLASKKPCHLIIKY
jgi:hypothetical protein